MNLALSIFPKIQRWVELGIKLFQKNSLSTFAPIVGVLLLVAIFIQRCGISLWLDELGGLVNISSSVWDTARATYLFQGQDPLYYSFLSVWINFFGNSEITLRVPSLIFGILGILVLFRTLELLYDSKEAFLYLLVFISISDFYNLFSWARPYSLSILLALLALYQTLKLTKKPKFSAAASLVISLAALGYTQILFLYWIPCLAICYIILVGKSIGSRDLRLFSLVIFCLLVLLTPQIFALFKLSEQAGSLSYLSDPSIWDLFTKISFNGMLPLGIIGSVLIAKVFGDYRVQDIKLKSNKGVILGSVLGVIPLIGIFLFSIISPISLFGASYLILTQVGIYFLWTGIIASLRSTHFDLSMTIFLLLIICSGFSNYGWHEDWRGAIKSANLKLEDGDATLVLNSGFIEGESLFHLNSEGYRDFLLSPVLYYKSNQVPKLIPSDIIENEKWTRLESAINNRTPSSKVVLISRVDHPEYIYKLRSQLNTYGLTELSLQNFVGVIVAVYK